MCVALHCSDDISEGLFVSEHHNSTNPHVCLSSVFGLARTGELVKLIRFTLPELITPLIQLSSLV